MYQKGKDLQAQEFSLTSVITEWCHRTFYPNCKSEKSQKRIRTFPLFHNSYIEQQAMDNANQPEELVPIRIDMELEGLVLELSMILLKL